MDNWWMRAELTAVSQTQQVLCGATEDGEAQQTEEQQQQSDCQLIDSSTRILARFHFSALLDRNGRILRSVSHSATSTHPLVVAAAALYCEFQSGQRGKAGPISIIVLQQTVCLTSQIHNIADNSSMHFSRSLAVCDRVSVVFKCHFLALRDRNVIYACACRCKYRCHHQRRSWSIVSFIYDR